MGYERKHGLSLKGANPEEAQTLFSTPSSNRRLS